LAGVHVAFLARQRLGESVVDLQLDAEDTGIASGLGADLEYGVFKSGAVGRLQ
jgi:hypothetical protein